LTAFIGVLCDESLDIQIDDEVRTHLQTLLPTGDQELNILPDKPAGKIFSTDSL
jgi:hypothetical protein